MGKGDKAPVRLTPINYIEITWVVASLFFGSLLYEQYYDGNFFINVALIAAVASPVWINRFLLAAKLTRRQQLFLSAIYVIACLWFVVLILDDRYSGALGVVPAGCSVVFLFLRWLTTPSQA